MILSKTRTSFLHYFQSITQHHKRRTAFRTPLPFHRAYPEHPLKQALHVLEVHLYTTMGIGGIKMQRACFYSIFYDPQLHVVQHYMTTLIFTNAGISGHNTKQCIYILKAHGTQTLPGSSKGSKVFWSVFLTYQSNIRPTNGEISVTPASAHATAYITFELHSKHAHTRRQVPTKHYCKWSVTGVQSRGSATIAQQCL